MSVEFDPSALNHLLKDYYKDLYPSKLICRWLSYGKKPDEFLERREFAFIYEGDVHSRYKTFTSAEDLRAALLRDPQKPPHKIDFGAVYNVPTQLRQSTPDFKPEERELVFDIDLDEYKDVRRCCIGATVCQKCWKFIVLAAKVLNVILREHFGFEHMLWLFSGRRGLHCWVADETARRLENSDRSAVAAYLTFRMKELPFDKDFIHPFASDVYNTLMQSKEIDELVVEQEWLVDERSDQGERSVKVLDAYAKDDETREFLQEAMSRIDESEPETRWRLLKDLCDERTHRLAVKKGRKLPDLTPERINFLRTLVLDRLNPRLDTNVTTATNHLLKSPFCVHPKTGRVAVPFEVDQAADFRIDQVPRIDLLVAELHEKTKSGELRADGEKENRKLLGYKHTALAPWIRVFESFLKGLGI